MSEDLLPPLTAKQRDTLARLAADCSILQQKAWTHLYAADGTLLFDDVRTSIAGLVKRALIAERKPTPAEYKRGAYRVAYDITDAGRKAHEALAKSRSVTSG